MLPLRLIVVFLSLLAGVGARAGVAVAPLPETLAGTGIERPGTLGFAPQYPLWSDAASKRRWIALPRGGFIDGTRTDAWQFPAGTRVWKEFSVGGRKVETRLIERLPDGTWRFASYVWNSDGSEARLAPARGTVVEGIAGAPEGRWEIPSRADCLACHESAAVPVLGLSALQLSPDRDPLAPHADRRGDIDLSGLIARGLLRGYRGPLAPRIAAANPEARAALGTLHANCGHCHNSSGNAAPVPLVLAQPAADALRGVDQVLRSLALPTRLSGVPAVVPGDPAASLLVQRMGSRDPMRQMPPLGSRIVDAESLALIERWISHPLNTENTP